MQTNPSHAPPFRTVLPSVLFIALLFFVNYTGRAVLGPLLVYLENALELDHVQSTSFLLLVSSGFCMGMLCSGAVTSKVRPRVIVSFSAISGGCMLLLLSQASSLMQVRVLLALLGFGNGFYLNAALATMGTFVQTSDWSRAIAVHELAPAISFIISPILADTAATAWGWQGAMAFMGVCACAAGLLFLLFGKGGNQKADRPSASGLIKAFKNSAFWVFIWLFALGVAGEFAPFSVLSLSLTTEWGLGNDAASRLLSLSRLAAPVAALMGGWAVARIGVPRVLHVFLLVHGSALMVMALPREFSSMVLLFFAMTIQAGAAAFIFPALFTFFARSFPSGQQPILLSLALPLASYTGSGIFPFLLGASGQYCSFSLGYFAFGCLCLVSVLLLVFHFQRTRAHSPASGSITR